MGNDITDPVEILLAEVKAAREELQRLILRMKQDRIGMEAMLRRLIERVRIVGEQRARPRR